MPSEAEELKSLDDELVAMIATLSNSQRLLTLSALDYQSLGLAKRHEKEKAIQIADDLRKVLEVLIKLLKKKVGWLASRIDSEC
ncbi:MAG TPA: hypothetical protein VIM29_04685 [Bacillota bacterium]